jgi:hypothetical protein
MKINSVLVIPGAGHSDDAGNYTRGVAIDSLAEVDVVDVYGRVLLDILEEYGIRYDVAPTRKAPGVREVDRLSGIPENTLALDLRVGYFHRYRKLQESVVEYGQDDLKSLANLLSETVGEWGKCCAWGHRTTDVGPLAVSCSAIRISPFSLNGPDASVYLRRLEPLGREIGLVLVEYLGNRNLAQARVPVRAW